MVSNLKPPLAPRDRAAEIDYLELLSPGLYWIRLNCPPHRWEVVRVEFLEVYRAGDSFPVKPSIILEWGPQVVPPDNRGVI